MPTRPARARQITLGLLWVIDGALQFQPYMFGKSFVTTVLLPSAAGQPGFIGSPISWIAHLIEPHLALFNAFAATIEILIGIGLLYRPTVGPALAVSFAWAMGIWFVGEGLGMLLTGTACPLTGAPGAALLYLLAGLLCWPVNGETHPTPNSPKLGLLGERAARLAYGAIWLGCAVLWLLPADNSTSAVHDAIAGAPSGAGWLSGALDAASNATAGHGTTIAIALAIASGMIGVAVMHRWHSRAFLVLAIALSVLYWVLGQGLGGIFTGQATDVGSGPLMILIASILIPKPGRTPAQLRLRSPLMQSPTPRSGDKARGGAATAAGSDDDQRSRQNAVPTGREARHERDARCLPA